MSTNTKIKDENQEKQQDVSGHVEPVVMCNVESIFPANDFCVVADSAKDEVVTGLIIGYDKNGALSVFGGGLLDGKQPVCKDWLWLIESFKQKLIKGDYT